MVYYLYAIYHSLGNSVCAVSAQELVEKRFIQCEVPLMILAFVLDPKYIHIVEGFLEWQETQNSMFSIKYLAQAAQAYYVKVSTFFHLMFILLTLLSYFFGSTTPCL